MLKELPEADPVPTGLYSKAYLFSQFNSEVGPGGYPCVGFNQPLLWYSISLDPPPGHPWAGKDWDSMSEIFAADFDRVKRADSNRLELYAVGRKALATDSSGAFLQPKAVEELENRYDKLLSNVTRLYREINNLNKRASARPTPAGTVAEGERQVTSTMAAYGSTLEHTVRMQLVWLRKQVEKAEQAALACRQLLRGQSGSEAPMASRVNAEEYDSSTGTQGASKRTKKKKKKTPQFYAGAAGREIGGCSVGIFKTWRECDERVNRFSGCSFKGFAHEDEAEAG
jgi:hypothetical protein